MEPGEALALLRDAKEIFARIGHALTSDDTPPSALPRFGEAIAGAEPDMTTEALLVDIISLAEQLRNQVDAIQAHAEVGFHARHMARQREQGFSRDKLGAGVAEQVALARGANPTATSRELALRRVIVETMPKLRRDITAGTVSIQVAQQAARAVLVLADDDRARVDAALAGELATMTPRRAHTRAQALANALDPHAAVARVRRNAASRRVTIRPVGEGIAQLTATLPTADAVACYKHLTHVVRSGKSRGAGRSRGQIMADTLVARVTGQESVEDGPIEIQLLMTDRALLAGGHDPAEIDGMPVPAHVARHLALGGMDGITSNSTYSSNRSPSSSIEHAGPDEGGQNYERPGRGSLADPGSGIGGGPGTGAESARIRAEIDYDLAVATGRIHEMPPADEPRRPTAAPPDSLPPVARAIDAHGAERFIRRLYADPETGHLAAADQRKRRLPAAVRAFVLARDRVCRMPGCDAPIAHIDHVHRFADGGPTSVENSAGVCERFNYVKEFPGWSTSIDSNTGDPRTEGALRIITPTGHEYVAPLPRVDDGFRRGGA